MFDSISYRTATIALFVALVVALFLVGFFFAGVADNRCLPPLQGVTWSA